MITINDLVERGVMGAAMVCPSCAQLFSVEFRAMFLDGKTEYNEIPTLREFRCPSCNATPARLIHFTIDTIPPRPRSRAPA